MPKYLQGKLGRETAYDEDLYHAYGVDEYWKEVRKEINKL